MEKKYKLTDDTIEVDGVTLHRIQALRDIDYFRFGYGNVKVRKGDLGGYVESDLNLNHRGGCWIYKDAKVMGHTRVCDNASLYGRAVAKGGVIRGDATIIGSALIEEGVLISGRARIADKVTLCGDVIIGGNAKVYGETNVSGASKPTRIFDDAHVNCKTVADGARISGSAQVRGVDVVVLGATLSGVTKVEGDNIIIAHGVTLQSGLIGSNAVITDTRDAFVMSPVGSENGTLTVYTTKGGELYCTRGCFEGSLDRFEKAVEESHRIKNPKVYNEYQKIIELIKFKKFLDLHVEEKFPF